MMSSTGPKLESRLTATLAAGPLGATRCPATVRSAAAGSKNPTQRCCTLSPMKSHSCICRISTSFTFTTSPKRIAHSIAAALDGRSRIA